MLIHEGVARSVERESGATATEYVLLLGLIALVIIIGVAAYGDELFATFDDSADVVETSVN